MRSFLKEATATAVFLLAVAMMLGLFFLALCCQSARGDALEDCIRATCRIKAGAGPMKSVGTGVLYDVATLGGETTAFVATAAHVVEGSGPWVCEFDRVGVKVPMRIYWRVPGHDGALLIAPRAAFGPRVPRPIPLLRRGIRLRVGQSIFSVGCPGGGKLMLWRGRARGYEQGGSMLFWPWPELGRSGSPIFALYENGAPCVVAIISARYSGPYDRVNEQTLGRATSIDEFWSGSASTRPTNATLCQGAITVPGGCPGGICPVPGSRDWYFSPYRQHQDRRIDNIEYQIQQKGAEKSPGTLPLPPAPQQVDLGPLTERLSRAELQLGAQAREITELKARQDRVRETAEALANKYEERLPGIAADVAEAVGKARAASDRSAEAHARATETMQSVDSALDEDNPKSLLARVKARLDDRFGAVFATLPWLKYGLIGLAVGLGYLFLRREGAKAAAGEPTVAQRAAALTPTQIDDRIADRIAGVQASIHERLAGLHGTVANLAGSVSALAQNQDQRQPPAPPAKGG